MKTLLICLFLCLSAAHATAQQPELAALKKLGGQWKEKDGAVIDLKVNIADFGDDEYRLIGGLTSLKSLSISGKGMSDSQLEMLTGLTELQSILINGTQLTDDGYRHFAAFKNLHTLSLFHPSRDVKAFTGAGLTHLKSLPSLQRLTFAGATAGDEAFAAIGELKQVTSFRQWHNLESPDGVKHLLSLTNLKSLKMGQRLPRRDRPPTPSFDDGTLAVIAKMKSLETLDLQEARLSFAGLSQLQQLPNLKQLKLAQVDIAAADVEKLKVALPNVKIDWEPLSAEGAEMLKNKLKL